MNCTISKKIEDLTGKKFGLLTVIRRDDEHSSDRNVKWICRCECGTEISRYGFRLPTYKVPACPVCKSKIMSKSKHPLYFTYYRLPKDQTCQEWLDSFEKFSNDMGSKKKGQMLSRKDKEKPYCKDNCFWEDTWRTWEYKKNQNERRD